jgi:small subunit ribosomal protein S15
LRSIGVRDMMRLMLTKRKKQNVIKDSRIHDTDTGSSEVQAAMLSKKIEELAGHLKTHPKDNHSRRGLIGMVADRHSALKYLHKKHPERYVAITKKLGLKQK